MHEISKRVENFVMNFIHSVYELEILMMLRDHRDKEWTALAVSQALLIQESAVEVKLQILCTTGLLLHRSAYGKELYCYKPRTAELEHTASELAHTYLHYRIRVINLIASQPVDKIRTFADAFKIRKDNEEP